MVCIDADTGEEHWVLKLAPDQIHASPTLADGKLYVPMFDGKVFIVKDLGNQGEVLSEIDLGSACLAAPAAAHGRVFVQSKKKLYCFGKDLPAPAFVTNRMEELKHFCQDAPSSDAVSLQVVPSEFSLKAGETQNLMYMLLDARERGLKDSIMRRQSRKS